MKASEDLRKELCSMKANAPGQSLFYVGWKICQAIEELTDVVRAATRPKDLGPCNCKGSEQCTDMAVVIDYDFKGGVLVCQSCYDDRRT